MGIVTPGVMPASRMVSKAVPPWLQRFARLARGLRHDDLPEETLARTRLVLLDSVGAIIAGRAEPEVAGTARRLGKPSGAGRKGLSPLMAAFMDGMSGTTLEIDEGNQYARGHPAIHVVPAVLAMGRLRKVTGREAVVATVLGYEIGARIGIASKLKVTMHPHGVWGTVGAAVACARLDKAKTDEIVQAVNIAANFGLTTSRKTMLEGASVRNTYAGFSNMLGLMAWQMAKAGVTGERDGVGSVYDGIAADGFDSREMSAELGSRWEIARNYFKRHAACRYTHGALDALHVILGRIGRPITVADVAAIRVETYVWAAQLDHPEPQTMLAAKFSLPFALATTIAHGAATLDAFRDAARADAAIRALAARVTVDEDPALTARLPGVRPARVTLTLTDGQSFTHEVLTNRGDTEDPYPADEVIAKFREVATPVVGEARAADIEKAILSIDGAADLRPLIRMIQA
jgi:2-methylcitrate dehydratase PrpD